MTHIVGKLDSVLQKVADHRQEVMTNMVVTSPTANKGHDPGQDNDDPSPQSVTLRKRSSVDGNVTDSMASVTPLRDRIQNMRLSVSSIPEQNSNFNSLNRERRRKRSPASSTVESSGEHSVSENQALKETTSRV